MVAVVGHRTNWMLRVGALLGAEQLTTWAEDRFYGEHIVFKQSSPYQRMVVTDAMGHLLSLCATLAVAASPWPSWKWTFQASFPFQLTLLPPASLRATKRLMKEGATPQIAERMSVEGKQFGEMLRAPEAREAFTAFFEKRRPDFSKFN